MYVENLFVCISVPLCIALPFVEGGAKRFGGFLLSGMTICLLSAYVNSFLMSVTGLSVDDTAVFITPISEECMKLMPLLFYFLVFYPKDNSLLASAVAIGVGFATFENCCYLLSGGTENLSYILIRGLAVGVMHTMCAVAVGYGLIFMMRVRYMATVGALGILSLTVTFHAVYNLLVSIPGVSRSVGYGLPLLTAVIAFVALTLYKKRKTV